MRKEPGDSCLSGQHRKLPKSRQCFTVHKAKCPQLSGEAVSEEQGCLFSHQMWGRCPGCPASVPVLTHTSLAKGKEVGIC